MKVNDMTVENLMEAESLYEKRFGQPPPVSFMDGGGFDGLLDLLKTALLTGKPIDDPYKDDPEGELAIY